MELTLGQMMRISIAMPLLLVLSILVLAQALERLYVFWHVERMPADLWDRVKRHLRDGDFNGAVGACRYARGAMPEALARLLTLPEPTPERLVETFQLYRHRMQMDLTRRVALFGTASFIAPLIGLMGTVLGIMRAFHDLAKAGAGGPAVVAAGISEALVATAAGIGVAVASAILYNYFTSAVRARMGLADLWVLELAQILEPGRHE